MVKVKTCLKCGGNLIENPPGSGFLLCLLCGQEAESKQHSSYEEMTRHSSGVSSPSGYYEKKSNEPDDAAILGITYGGFDEVAFENTESLAEAADKLRPMDWGVYHANIQRRLRRGKRK